MYALEGETFKIADVAFETDKNPTQSGHFILDALTALGIGKYGSQYITTLGEHMLLSSLPKEKLPATPDWSNDYGKLWIINRFVPPQERL